MPGRLQPDPGTAGFVGNREAVPAYGFVFAMGSDDTDTAGPDDQRRAVLAGMRTKIGNYGIACEADRFERVGRGGKGFGCAGALIACNADACADSVNVVVGEAGVRDRCAPGGFQCVQAVLEPDTRIGCAGMSSAEDISVLVDQARAAMAAAGIQPQIKRYCPAPFIDNTSFVLST